MTMRNQMKTGQRRSAAPLPVVTTPRGLQELREEAARLDVDLSAFARFATPPARILNHYDRLDDGDIALVRRIGSEIDVFRARWLAINQLATDEQIASEMLRLTTTMATSGNLNPNLLNETLCEDIAELEPTLFALVRGCRGVRAKYRFLNISDLVAELQEAERDARRYSYALEDFNLEEFNEDLQAQIQHDEASALEWKGERKRRKIAEHRQRKADREIEKWQRRWLAGEGENDEEGSDDNGASE
jgi:hypothetical protein